MKAKIDQSGCIGCGLCASTCPEVFRMVDDLAEVYADVTPAVEGSARDAAVDCPVSVIEIEE